MVHRVHLTNLAQINPNIEPLFPQHRGQPDDFMHMLWLCPNLSTFKMSILKAFSEQFEIQFDHGPVCALSDLTSKESCALLPNKAYVVIAFITLPVRHLILLNCIS